jgi:hypothetical protein
MTTVRPLSADPVLAPLLRARPLPRRSGAFVVEMAKKPALARQDPAGYVREQLTAQAFGAVLDEMGIANTHIACIWGVSESVVRGVRSRAKPLTLSKVQQLPDDLRAAIDRKTDELLAELRALRASLPALSEALRSSAPAAANDHHIPRPR